MKFEIPAAILGQHIAVLGKTGSGKTSTEKLIIEEVVEHGFRVCVLDTVKSDWWGITSSASGKHDGLPFKILGGPHGHVPMHSSAGKVIGQLVGSGKLPLSIVDMADFEAGGIQKFFTDFAPSLMRNAKGVVYLVIEESHELAPKERAGFGSENLAIHWAKKLATAGRSKGIRLIVATQRVQALHNAVLGSCETVIAHRLTTPADQEPVVKWLRSNTTKETADTVAESLSSLPTGTGWLCSGEAKCFEKIAFPKFKTYDNTATPTGDSQEICIKTAEVDQVELGNLIGVAVEEAKANDPAELKRTISDLKRKLADAERRPEVKQSEPEKVPVFDESDRDLLHKAQSAFESLELEMGARMDEVRTIYRELNSLAGRVGVLIAKRPSIIQKTIPRQLALPRADRIYREKSNGHDESISGGLRRMLVALAQRSPLTKRQLGVRAGLSSTSGTFGTYLARLRTNGWIDGSGDNLSITDDGAKSLGAYDPLPEGQELLRYWLSDLGQSGAARMLEVLAEVYPRALSKEELGERAEISSSSGTFGTYLAKLRTLELAEGRGEIRASKEFFE